jgi:hypothetical protein
MKGLPLLSSTEVIQAGLDGGVLSSFLPILVYVENPYSKNTNIASTHDSAPSSMRRPAPRRATRSSSTPCLSGRTTTSRSSG